MSSALRYASLSNDQLRLLHSVCDQFEQALQVDNSTLIESRLGNAPAGIQDALFRELLEIELESRMLRQPAPELAEYNRRFPDQTELIASVFAQLEQTNAEQMPAQIGRYRVDSQLGSGGFATVYLAFDDQLQRPVAIKVPRQHLISQRREVSNYMAEAQTVASLIHPHIVPVHDVGHDKQFPCYIVSQYIEGTDLSKFLKENRLSWKQSAFMVADIADALHFAHMKGVVHRDVKPGNILLDERHTAFLTDFGLAIRESVNTDAARLVGTPAYMSPEQSRGEGHRVDGRSDVYSLGAVFYEVLTGQRIFFGKSRLEILDELEKDDPKPPRQIDDSIPRELERICLKAMAVRARERYSTAQEMAEELRYFLDQPESTGSSSAGLIGRPRSEPSLSGNSESALQPNDLASRSVIPHGLRSFDESDADFFPELIAGPRDRYGIPESIRFWKSRIEESNEEKTFKVGVLYGPSGCGKSSLMKAGIIPRLSDKVRTVFVEAAAGETENRFLQRLRKHFPNLPADLSLKDALATLRLRTNIFPSNKILVVIDQFEQWLHSEYRDQRTELIAALRQCDGSQIQTILLVRDDFWLGISRLMSELEIDLVAGTNLALVDLFDKTHAKKVLSAFGKAYGRLPDKLAEFTRDQKQFLNEAINDLSVNEKVISVRVALFAEMMKDKPWDVDSLKDVDGMRGIGVSFLEETFNTAANPVYRRHQLAARKVLAALLPTTNIDIKGQLRSLEQLQDCSGYSNQLNEFKDLIRILDSELHLISPTDSTAHSETDNPPITQGSERHYQLTHDYLIHSLREWLTRKQKETRRGRAEILLEDRSMLWNSKPENHRLPSALEWLTITTLTEKKDRTPDQQKMIGRAGWFHTVRWSLALLAVAAIAFLIQRTIASNQQRNLLAQVRTSVDAIVKSSGRSVPFVIEDLESYPPDLVTAELRSQVADFPDDQKLRLNFALANFGSVDHEFLAAQIETLPSMEVENMITALSRSSDQSLAALHALAKSTNPDEQRDLRNRLAIVAMYLGDTSLMQEICEIETDATMCYELVHSMSTWRGDDSRMIDIAAKISDPDLRYTLCLALGSTPADRLLETTKSSCVSFLSDWYRDDADSGVHSASGWALRNMSLSEPPLPATGPESEESWHTNSLGMTMVELPAGRFTHTEKSYGQFWSDHQLIDRTIVLTKPFCISDREISVGLFRQFIDETSANGSANKPTYIWFGTETKMKLDDHFPAPWVDWQSAALFCNWLSAREGRETCYKKTGESWNLPTHGDIEKLEFDPSANGYRLPTEYEWEYASRAGAETKYFFGSDPQAALRFANISSTGLKKCGELLPNRWGMFDMQGNVTEWNHNWNSKLSNTDEPHVDPMGPPGHPLLFMNFRGGDFRKGLIFIESGMSGGRPVSGREMFDGFRLMRPLH